MTGNKPVGGNVGDTTRSTTKPSVGAGNTAATDNEYELDSEEGGPVSSFQSYAAEGDILAKQGDYRKAIEAYSKALTLRAMDKNALVARSKCFLQLGDSQAALIDADAALKEDHDFFKGVFQKAEALYSKGDFEMALVYYHRGNKLRPELDEFRLGIQKAREAIDNSIGDPKDYKFQPPPGARLVVSVPTGSAGRGLSTQAQAASMGIATGMWVSTKTPAPPGFNANKEVNKGEKTVKQLLGELYADKEYLADFIEDRDFSNNPNDEVRNLVDDALKYLETRTEFWRQQKPIYARKKEQSKVLAKAINTRNRHLILVKAEEYQRRQAAELEREQNPKAAGGYRPRTAMAAVDTGVHDGNADGTPDLPTQRHSASAGGKRQTQHQQGKNMPASALRAPPNPQAVKMVETCFTQIRQSMGRAEYEIALRRSKNLLARLSEIRGLPDKDHATVDLYNLLGSIYLQLGNSVEAMNYYKKELTSAKETRFHDAIGRALGEVGRIHVKTRRYKDAITVFDEKVSYSVDGSIERAWLYHDLGRCYLEIKQFERAVQYGEKCIGIADAVKDRQWGMNARVLVAQALAQLKMHDRAIEYYTSALTYAKELIDEPAVHAITKVIDDMKKHMRSATANTDASVSGSDVQTRPITSHTRAIVV